MARTMEPTDDIKTILADLEDRRGMSAGINAMRTRRGMFRDEYEMMLTGAGIIPEARRLVNDQLTTIWANSIRNPFADYSGRDVIIGAGFAAAVFAATTVQLGRPRPIVLEAGPATRIGGAFTIGGFYLNSGNRPGSVGAPGDVMSSLNYIPGAPVQPSMITGREFSTAEEMAFTIRLALMQWAEVYPDEKVTSVDTNFGNQPEVFTANGSSFLAGHVFDFRGMGEPSDASISNGTTILTFPQFMQRMTDSPFPLDGIGRLAVRGNGDSAKCAVEAALGIGPSTGMSVTGMDFVPQIDWYAPSLPQNCQQWRQTQRGRYQRIGSYLRRQDDPFDGTPDRSTTRRLKIIPDRANILPTLDGALVNAVNYDTVVTCTGNTLPTLTGLPVEDMSIYRSGGLDLGRRVGNYYMAGTAAQLPFSNAERDAGFDSVAANSVAMFRQGPKLSALAASLPAL
jgi:hypothetical protein